MKLIIGLGNPGKDYSNTRHNVGYRVIEALQKVASSKKFVAGGKQFKIAKSDKFMNESGIFVKKLSANYHLPTIDLYVIHDDLDILLGNYKIQLGRGPKDHNGLASIDAELGTNEYWHVRVGVDKRDPQNRVMGEEYVLQDFSDEEKRILDKTIKEVTKKLISGFND